MKQLVIVLSLLVSLAASAQSERLVRRNHPIQNRYIVVLNSNVTDIKGVAGALLRAHGGKQTLTYDSAFKGFLLEAPEGVAVAISRDPRVDFVEQDHQLQLANASWALDRIDDRITDRMDGSYAYCNNGVGEKTFVYVFDTGIWFGHDQFTNMNTHYNRPRVETGFDAWDFQRPNESANPCNDVRLPRWPGDDQPYNAAHGTAVASIIGGKTMGVAPDAILRPVLIAPCYGVTADASAINAGAQWMVKVLDDKGTPDRSDDIVTTEDPVYLNYPGAPRVANMSFTNDYAVSEANDDQYALIQRSTIEASVNHLVNYGVTVVVAAGNSDRPVEGYDPRHFTHHTFTPARVDAAITVGGTKGRLQADPDRRWDDGSDVGNPGSNFGAKIDISAPAKEILAAHFGSTLAVRDKLTSGTSFATALVTGAVARRLTAYPHETPQQVRDYLVNVATTDTNHALNLSPSFAIGTPNRLLWTPFNSYSDTCRPRIVGP